MSNENGGRVTTRDRRAKRAIELRAQGLIYREIAKRMRISTSYAYDLCADPTGDAVRARKDSYRGVCEECGGATDGSNGRDNAPTICRECFAPAWTPEAAIAAVDAFFAAHNRSPRVIDAENRSDGGELPYESTAKRLFGGWNGLLLAAGLPLNIDRRESTQRDMEQMLRAGKSVGEVAEAFGWTYCNVRERLKTRGLTPQDLGARDCNAEWRAQREHVARRYREGALLREIADELGCTNGNVNVLLCKMRKAGVDLPYRNPGAAARFERVAA